MGVWGHSGQDPDLDTGRQADVWKGQSRTHTASPTYTGPHSLRGGSAVSTSVASPPLYTEARPGQAPASSVKHPPSRVLTGHHAHSMPMPAPSAPGPSLSGPGQSLSAQLSWALRNVSLPIPPSPQIFQEVKSLKSYRQKLLGKLRGELLVL